MGENDNSASRVIAAAVISGIAAVLGVICLFGAVIALLIPTSSASQCSPSPGVGGEGGEWLATAYGPPWVGIQGSGITSTGINLQHDPHEYIIAVDPSVIPLGTYWHVSPNPWGDPDITFLAGDTGGAIEGRHVDIYDWEGRAAQDAWGARKVTVTSASKPGSADLLGQAEAEAPAMTCQASDEGPLPLTASETAEVESDGLAAAPKNAPPAVKAMIAGGNELVGKPYIYGGGHGEPLSTLQPGYDCSSSVSFVLHAGGAFGDLAWGSTELETYGDPGPGRWVTIYANSEHAFMFVAGLRFDTVYAYDNGPNAGKSGPRWRVYPGVPDPGPWVVRHPPGL